MSFLPHFRPNPLLYYTHILNNNTQTQQTSQLHTPYRNPHCNRLFPKQTAIATSLNLRCYGVLSPRNDGKVAIQAPDLEAECEWDISQLPWDAVPAGAGGSKAPTDLDETLLKRIEDIVAEGHPSSTGFRGSVAWLYMYMIMAGSRENA